jgi:protein tyrosine phosphatase
MMTREDIRAQCVRADVKEEFTRLNRLWTDVITQYASKSETYPFSVAYENRAYNRYADVLPFDASRVKVAGLPLDYINGSWVDGENEGERYIVTQAPMPETITAFWLMVWEQKCSVIVNLTRRFEKGKEKCAQYWPQHHGEEEEEEEDNPELYTGDVRIVLVDTKGCGDLIVRTFEIYYRESDEKRVVTQLHYREWPDFGLPASTAAMREVVRLTDVYNTNGQPPIIHCTAGIGRAGTFVALHVLSRKLDRSDPEELLEWDISASLLRLRTFRLGLVQTSDQFAFLHTALRDHMAPPPPVGERETVLCSSG